MGEFSKPPSGYLSSDQLAHVKEIASFERQVQALQDGVDVAIGDWENTLSADVVKQLPQYTRFADFERRVGVLEEQMSQVRATKKRSLFGFKF